MKNELHFIGKVLSPLKRIEDCPLQENEAAPGAQLEIFSDFQAGIGNITEGSDILVLTWLHQADRTVIKCYPRKNHDAPHIGVFSTRSPDRPNPIGIHNAKVVSVKNGVIHVSALEVLDQTPIIDIKPVI